MSAYTRCLSAAALGAFVAVSVPAPALAGDVPPPACEPLGHVQKRIVQKAGQGVEALRDYIVITRGVYELDMMTIAASLDAWIASARCAGMVVDEDVVRRNVALAIGLAPQ